MEDLSEVLSNLLYNRDAKSKHFIENIRSYNMMYFFTSMGEKIDNSVNKGNGSLVFRLHGQNYHMIKSLLQIEGSILFKIYIIIYI